ncbi:uncharacterized protein PHACADRAFT_212001 [Phanerochaete carnosa HHB-10118-sp]|uniref:NADP-dependent oxidoreductase domain-containing protein n=1 Tax=Phanerochaete carnosa (strain HHB-10118-sp) TaxID=650164 RepID=K5W1Q7_PHACS|nr:uncharacterized protein PHACADRAFT_212001 [Phanerochaete carnosa HHB-10118-sp]EKM52789.1 hypothetical protein PHACADRAFT_212001 [Phanerochaete carnosa HHB-10118-sp]
MSHAEQKNALNVVMGAGNFGAPGIESARVTSVKDVEAILDVLKAHGHNELDTATMYGQGTSEKLLGETDWKKRGTVVSTKLLPVGTNGRAIPGLPTITHREEDLRKYLDTSLKALKTDTLDVWYLHGPDRSTPYEVTMKAVDRLYREGKFKRFGISNYMSWEVAQIVEICKANGYVKPTVYQGLYNAMNRNVEPELFPCLRKYGISFYAFNPLGGSFFTGRYRSLNDQAEANSRFDPNTFLGRDSHRRYWNDAYFNALTKIEEVAKKHNLTLAEVTLRWLSHHSLLKREHGDAIMIGGSGVEQVEENLTNLEKGPLPEDVVKTLDEVWLSVKAIAANYFH